MSVRPCVHPPVRPFVHPSVLPSFLFSVHPSVRLSQKAQTKQHTHHSSQRKADLRQPPPCHCQVNPGKQQQQHSSFSSFPSTPFKVFSFITAGPPSGHQKIHMNHVAPAAFSIHCVAGLDKTHLEGQFGVSPGGLIFRLKFGFESSHSWSRSALIGRHCRVSLVGGGLGVGRELRCCSREFVRVRARSSMAPPMVTDVSLPSAGRVLSIQSHTVHGYVGNKAAVFPLQLLGFDVDPINSVQFSNHTGYGTVKGQVLDGDELWALIEGLEANELLSYTHLLTGYIGSVSFLETVLRVVEKLRSVNPNLIYVCDPVMGDDGKFYVTPELVPVYREKVVPVATMITPNHFEAEQLTGRRIETEAEALQACADLHAAGPSKVVITSLSIDNMLTVLGSHVQSKGKAPKQFKIVLPKLHSYFTGTGDLMTALLLGWSHKFPDDLDKAAELAVSSLQAVLKNTIAGYDDAGVLPKPKTKLLELRLIQSVKEIQSPVINFFTEKLEQ